jgi:branched-chain amino acid transport system substrate-binding protein
MKTFNRRNILATGAAAAAASTLPSIPARGAGKSLTIGVCSDFSGTYSDVGGPTSVACVQQALQDFGASAKGYDVTVIQGDHQNKPDVGAGLARQWFDQGVDLLIDVRRRREEQGLYQLQRRDLEAHRCRLQRADHPLDL